MRAVLVLLAGLSARPAFAQTLTREKALALIRSSPTMRAPIAKVQIRDEQLMRAISDGILARVNGIDRGPTEKGRKYFSNYEYLVGATLVRPVHPEVTAVTGIRDGGQGVKVAEFVWHIKDVDEVQAKYAAVNNADQNGAAYLALYDDGWRVSRLETNYQSALASTRPFYRDPTEPEFRYLGAFETSEAKGERTLIELYRNGKTQLVGRLLYPVMEADSPHCRLDGTYDPATGKVSVHGVRKDDLPIGGEANDIAYSFTGIWRPDRLTGELTEQWPKQKPSKRALTLKRVHYWDDGANAVKSLEEWERN